MGDALITRRGGLGGLSESDAILRVTAPTGSTFTATKNGVSLIPKMWEQSTSGLETAIFIIPASSFDSIAWTVSITLGTQSGGAFVVIDSANEYNVEANFHVPAGYQEVEYIESSGTQWIDTGVTPHTTTISRIKFINLEATGGVIYGYNPNDTNDYRLFNFNQNYYYDAPSNKRISGGTLRVGATQELEVGNYYVKNLVTSANIISSGNLYTFNGIATITLNGDSSPSKNRWYYVFIYDDTIPLAELYPCYRISDSVAGMWDNVSKTFLTNQGTGSFTVGPDV